MRAAVWKIEIDRAKIVAEIHTAKIVAETHTDQTNSACIVWLVLSKKQGCRKWGTYYPHRVTESWGTRYPHLSSQGCRKLGDTLSPLILTGLQKVGGHVILDS